MANAYQYDVSGYFVGEVEDHGLLPNNATYTAPKVKEGHIPRWNGKKWEQVEDHLGEEGYLDGQPHVINEYGPLPKKGWSTTPPPPTPEEKAMQVRTERDGLITGTDYLLMPDYPISDDEREAVKAYRQALRDVTKQPGFPDVINWPERPEDV